MGIATYLNFMANSSTTRFLCLAALFSSAAAFLSAPTGVARLSLPKATQSMSMKLSQPSQMKPQLAAAVTAFGAAAPAMADDASVSPLLAWSLVPLLFIAAGAVWLPFVLKQGQKGSPASQLWALFPLTFLTGGVGALTTLLVLMDGDVSLSLAALQQSLNA